MADIIITEIAEILRPCPYCNGGKIRRGGVVKNCPICKGLGSAPRKILRMEKLNAS